MSWVKIGLPDGRAQPRGGQRSADDVAKNLLEGALDLAEAGEGVARVVTRGKRTPSISKKCRQSARNLDRSASALARSAAGSEAGFVEARIVALIEQMQDGVFIEHQVRLAGRRVPDRRRCAKLFGERLQALDNPPHVDARPLGISTGRLQTGSPSTNSPPRAARSHSSAFGQERIAVGELGDGREGRHGLRSREESHTVHSLYGSMHRMYIMDRVDCHARSQLTDLNSDLSTESVVPCTAVMEKDVDEDTTMAQRLQGSVSRTRASRRSSGRSFSGAFNDNVYKIIVSMRAVHVAAATGSSSEYLVARRARCSSFRFCCSPDTPGIWRTLSASARC